MSWGGGCSISWPWMVLDLSQAIQTPNQYEHEASRAALKAA